MTFDFNCIFAVNSYTQFICQDEKVKISNYFKERMDIMRYFLTKLSFFLLVLFLLSGTGCASSPGKSKFQKLFDGKSLNAFKKLGGDADYHIKDGAIVGISQPGTPNTFLCTKKRYGDFVLELETKVDPSLNSGIQIRSNSLPEYKNGIVHGYQVEIDPSGRAWSAGIYDEARRGWLNDLKDNEAARKAFKQNQWNHYKIVCIGDSLKTWINGVPAADLVDSMDLTGFIGLQVHGTKDKEPRYVRWKNLEIQELGKHTWKPLFDGKTLNGWHRWGGGSWKVENGIIEGTCDINETRYGLLVSDKIYDDFTVRLKFKAIEGNSGFYFRMEMVDTKVGFAGFQAEIDATQNAGGLYESGGRGWVVKPDPEDVKKYFKLQDWNQMTVSAHGRRLVVHVNGFKVADLKNDPSRLKGYFAFQLHAKQNVKVLLKDIELLVPQKD